MHEGTIVYWNKDGRKDGHPFGFIEERIPTLSGGFVLQKYYFNRRHVAFQMAEEIKFGLPVRFEVVVFATKRATELPLAVNVAVFDTLDQLDVYKVASAAQEAN